MRKLEALVNPFGKSESASPDEIRKVESVDELLDSVYAHHNKIAQKPERIKNLKLPALEPVQIMVLLQRITQKEKVRPYTGRFVTKLIESSYKKGNDSFKLDVLGDYSIDCVGHDLKGEKEKPVKITVLGDAGHWWANSSEYCIYEFMDNAGYSIGQFSTNCTYIFHGKVASVDRSAKNCNYLTSSPKLFAELEKQLKPREDSASRNRVELKGFTKRK